MRRRKLLFALLLGTLVLASVSVLAVGATIVDEPSGGGSPILAQQERPLDGGCIALDPAEIRPRLREEFCTLFCLETIPVDAEVAEVTRVLRRAPLSAREAAVDELLFNVSILDTAAAADAVPAIAARHGLPEDAVHEATAVARERLLLRLREEGDLDDANADCLLQRLRSVFRLDADASAD